ncbi:hypothetical protein H6G89_00930 [Oscillatoria sp. FACHB-1407]|uniref:hypothetical protein n=1 Tax=Oscillatoria sp. FACHB-1407 TaxID=2692847 RepID=UPI001689A87B|nr:hypothetical protein [Oscillatoria sp. FACHB-1407]MBD2459594.1 hypothetical protein [Oscillatoria sp. FACHB-1407]
MKSRRFWAIIPAALTMALAIATSAHADTVQTPLQSAVVVTGNSGGSQSSSCGFISGTPSQVVVVSQPTPLRFVVESQGQPTLLITGAGQNRCAMADAYSGGMVQIPGVLNPGTYSVFVGDRAQGSHPYTLRITQGN